MIRFEIIVPSSNYSTTFAMESNNVFAIKYDIRAHRLSIRYEIGNTPPITTDNGERWKDWNQSTQAGIFTFEDVYHLHI